MFYVIMYLSAAVLANLAVTFFGPAAIPDNRGSVSPGLRRPHRYPRRSTFAGLREWENGCSRPGKRGDKKIMIEALKSLGTGFIVGLIFAFVKLPIPAPQVLAGIFGGVKA